MNDQPYYYDEGQKAFIAGKPMDPYIEKMGKPPIKTGRNEVVLPKYGTNPLTLVQVFASYTIS